MKQSTDDIIAGLKKAGSLPEAAQVLKAVSDLPEAERRGFASLANRALRADFKKAAGKAEKGFRVLYIEPLEDVVTKPKAGWRVLGKDPSGKFSDRAFS